MDPQTPVISQAWNDLSEAIAREKGIVLILGATDTGKSTLAKFLVSNLCLGGIHVALVDADIGQSFLGPPTTIGLSFFDKPPDWSCPISAEIFFVGSTTPEENLSRHLEGVKKMTDRSLSIGAQVVLVDTTGLVSGELGKELKGRKIDLLTPRLLVALQRFDELEPLLGPYEERRSFEIFRLPVSRAARTRSREERKAYRAMKFRSYFEPSQVRSLNLAAISLEGGVTTSSGLSIYPEWALSIRGLLVGLNTSDGLTLALALLHHYSDEEGLLTVLTPSETLRGVKAIRLSSLRLNSSYEEERI